jgi:hypothetical protein
MAATASPYGIQVISDMVGVAPRLMRQVSGIVNGYGSNIFKGQPIKLVNGYIQPCTNPGGTPDPIYGVFDGVDFTPLGGRPTESPFWAAGTNVDTTQDFLVYYYPLWMPSARVKIQADGSVAQALMGSGFNFTNIGNGSTFTGSSQATVGAAGVPAGSQAQLALVEFYDTQVLDTIGDAFTDLICTIAYPQVGFRGQNSIG